MKSKVSKAGLIYLPKEIRDALGLYVELIPDDKATVLYPANEDLSRVKRSVEIILQHLELRIEDQQEKSGGGRKGHAKEKRKFDGD